MSTFFTPKLLAFILLFATQQGAVPSDAVGNWKIGASYYLGQSTNMTPSLEKQIKRLHISITSDHIDVCKKHLKIDAVEVHQLSANDFLQKFNFNPGLIELNGDSITEISINPLHTMNACLNFQDPGSHLFIADKHVVIEVNHRYFPLIPDK